MQRIILEYAILCTLVFLIIFLKMGSYYMHWWDESIFAVNTYEMMESGNYFTLFYNGEPDLFNTKPPLTIWLQVLSAKTFGYTEWAIRFPSALAAGITTLVLFGFTKKRFGAIAGWSAALVLLTAQGYLTYHGSRSGDSDALLTLFLLLANIYFLKFLFDEGNNNVFLFFTYITLAFCTKFFAAFLFIPAYLILLIWNKKFRTFVFQRQFWLGLSLLLIFGLGLIYLRQLDQPDYISSILFYDAGRMFTFFGLEARSFWFYMDNFFENRFYFWSTLLVIGLISGLSKITKKEIEIKGALVVLVLVYFLLISIAPTKLHWYDLPLYPLFAIIIGVTISAIFERFFTSEILKTKKQILLIPLFIYPLYLSFRSSQNNALGIDEKKKDANEIYLADASKNNKDVNNTKILYHGWDRSLLFYKFKLKEKGQTINLIKSVEDLRIGDNVLVSDDSLIGLLKTNYYLVKIDEVDFAIRFKIEGKR